MTPDRIVAHQLAIRLKRVKNRIATLTAEAEMIERMVADAEKFAVVPRLRLRKNSQGKWTVRGQVRRYLTEHRSPVKAQAIFDFLKQYDPSLNSSTFRSHLKRMVEDGTVKHQGARGHYQLVDRPSDEPEEVSPVPLRRVVVDRRSL